MVVTGNTTNHSFTGGSFRGDIFLSEENIALRFLDIFPGPLTGVPLSNCPPDEQFGPFTLCFKFSGGTFTYPSLGIKSSLKGGFAGVEIFVLPGRNLRAILSSPQPFCPGPSAP